MAPISMQRRLRPACFCALVIEAVIVRPGPIRGGRVHPYLRRRQGKGPSIYPSHTMQ
jgi:error-prone DNA polymerase